MIEWHKVTWYSQLVAILLFLATFIGAFYLGKLSKEDNSLEGGILESPREVSQTTSNVNPLQELGESIYSDGQNIYALLDKNTGVFEPVNPTGDIAKNDFVKRFSVSPYYKNDETVFFSSSGTIGVVRGADPQTFTLDIPNNNGLEFARDHRAVYYRGREIALISDNFKIIFPLTIRDCSPPIYFTHNRYGRGQKIYYIDRDGTIVEIVGADPETFRVLWTGYSKDKNYVYAENRRTNDNPTIFDMEDAREKCSVG